MCKEMTLWGLGPGQWRIAGAPQELLKEGREPTLTKCLSVLGAGLCLQTLTAAGSDNVTRGAAEAKKLGFVDTFQHLKKKEKANLPKDQ